MQALTGVLNGLFFNRGFGQGGSYNTRTDIVLAWKFVVDVNILFPWISESIYIIGEYMLYINRSKT